MAHCTQLCTTKKNFYSQQIKNFFLGITLFDTFSLLFQKEKNLMSLFLIACNRGIYRLLNKDINASAVCRYTEMLRLFLIMVLTIN